MRPTWDNYFLSIAEQVSTRSDCERSKVGAVVVKDRRIRATGYNGAPSGKPGCGTCPRRHSEVEPGSDYDTGPGRCVAVHAEANALLYCNREDLIDATLYLTREPCPGCLKLIEAAGIAGVVYPEGALYFGRQGFGVSADQLYYTRSFADLMAEARVKALSEMEAEIDRQVAGSWSNIIRSVN